MTLTVTANPASGGDELSVDIGAGNYAHSQESGIEGMSTVFWDGVGASGLGGADFTEFGTDDAFFLGLLETDGTFGLVITVTSSSGTSTFSSPFGQANVGTLVIPYSSFAGSANFSNVDAVQLRVNGQGQPARDVGLGPFTTGSVVPEPSTLSLFAVGALLLTRRLRVRTR